MFKIPISCARRNACLVMLKGISRPNFNIRRSKSIIPSKGLQRYCISSFLVWAAPELLCTNLVNVLLLVCIQPRNIYSRFVLFRITFFALNGSSNEKNLQNKKHKKEFCRTKSPRHGNLNHQGVFENELGALNCSLFWNNIYPTCISENSLN